MLPTTISSNHTTANLKCCWVRFDELKTRPEDNSLMEQSQLSYPDKTFQLSAVQFTITRTTKQQHQGDVTPMTVYLTVD